MQLPAVLIQFLRYIRFRLVSKNSMLEYGMRYGLAYYSRLVGWARSYSRWQKNNEYVQPVGLENKVVCFLHWQSPQRVETFNQKLIDCPAEWVVIASAPLHVAPFALQEIARAIKTYPQADLIYSDGDWLNHWGQRTNPWMKPAFGIDSLRAQNYIVPFFAVRKSLGDSLGWIRPEAGNAWAEDLVWRVLEQAREVVHIPRMLYHRVTTSVSDVTHYCQDEKRVLEQHLQRLQLDANIDIGPVSRTFNLRYELKAQPMVSIIIPSHELARELRRCVESILKKTTYQNFEILLVENNSANTEIFQTYRDLQALDARVRFVEHHHSPFNYAEVNNTTVPLAHGDILLFLNNDTEVISPDWLERMLEYTQRSDVGAVGAKLYYPRDLLQHVGVIIGLYGTAGHQFTYFPRSYPGYQHSTQLPQNYSAVTAACLMIRRQVFEEVNGFDTSYRLSYNDIDLCLRLRQKGYTIVWTPYAELYHHESLTRGYDTNTAKLARLQQEVNLFHSRWKSVLDAGDPYYNPNLALDKGYYSLRPGRCDHAPRSTKGLGLGRS